MTRLRSLFAPTLRLALLAPMIVIALFARPAAAIEMGDPNLSPDAAYCRTLTERFKREIAGAKPAQAEQARKTGERGAKLCRFERYREGITLLERALAALSAPAK